MSLPSLPGIIYIASPEADSPAARALAQEGVAFSERVLTGLHDYGKLFAEAWDRGERFIMLEWDVIPWPGAIADLQVCPYRRCSHRYPLNVGKLALSFGVGAYQPQGPAPDDWRSTRWDRLDGAVVPILNRRLGQVHRHSPAFAHARRETI